MALVEIGPDGDLRAALEDPLDADESRALWACLGRQSERQRALYEWLLQITDLLLRLHQSGNLEPEGLARLIAARSKAREEMEK